MAVKGKKKNTRSPELKVVLDSSAIYTSSAYYLLAHDVYDLIQVTTHHADLKVSWYLPDIVRHERQYQILRQSLELLPSLQKLERLLGHNLNITEQIIR